MCIDDSTSTAMPQVLLFHGREELLLAAPCARCERLTRIVYHASYGPLHWRLCPLCYHQSRHASAGPLQVL